VKEKLQNSYLKTKQFCQDKGLKLNCEKTRYIIIKAPSRKICQDDNQALVLDGSSFQPLQSVKLLGFTIDRHLTFSNHVDNVVSHCRGLLGILKKASHLLPAQLLLLMYTSLIRSKLEYSSAVIHSAAKSHLKKLETIQKIASRIISGAPPDAHSAPLMQNLGLQTLSQRRIKHITQIVQNCTVEKCHPAFNELFTFDQDMRLIQEYEPRTAAGRKRFSYYGRLIYSELAN
jgi:hypothetical protein